MSEGGPSFLQENVSDLAPIEMNDKWLYISNFKNNFLCLYLSDTVSFWCSDRKYKIYASSSQNLFIFYEAVAATERSILKQEVIAEIWRANKKWPDVCKGEMKNQKKPTCWNAVDADWSNQCIS